MSTIVKVIEVVAQSDQGFTEAVRRRKGVVPGRGARIAGVMYLVSFAAGALLAGRSCI